MRGTVTNGVEHFNGSERFRPDPWNFDVNIGYSSIRCRFPLGLPPPSSFFGSEMARGAVFTAHGAYFRCVLFSSSSHHCFEAIHSGGTVLKASTMSPQNLQNSRIVPARCSTLLLVAVLGVVKPSYLCKDTCFFLPCSCRVSKRLSLIATMCTHPYIDS